MKFNTIVIIFLVLAVVIVGVGVWKLTRVDNKQVNPDVPNKCYGNDCKFDCGVLNPSTVVRCKKNSDGTSVCSKCKCDASGRLSGCMDCQDTDPNDPKTVIRNSSIKNKLSCVDPFFWDEKEGSCKLTKGSYCLPVHVDDITCNPYTGNKVLELDQQTNTYRWACVCKNDLKFSGNTCSNINVCGLEGESQNPNNSLGRGLLKAGTTNVYWNNDSDWDPLVQGNSQCSCRANEVADNNLLLCLPNSCSPGSPNTDDPSGQSCSCDPDQGLVDCSSISISYDGIAPYYNGACKFPSCVPDPCAGDGKDGKIHGQYKIKYDKGNAIGGYCVCNPGYHLVPDPNAYGGFTCKELCIDNGPCGNRGQCNVQDLDKAFTQFTIRCKDMDSDGQCTSSLFMIIYNSPNPSTSPNPSSSPNPSNNQYYLNYYKDSGNLILEDTQNPDSFFNFKLKKCKIGDNNQPDCTDTTTSPVDKGLNSSSYYYILIGDKYLSFNPLGDGKYNLVDENDPQKENSLFLFISQEGNKRPLANVSGTMFFPFFQRYLSINPKDRSIIYDPVSKTQEYCDPCEIGYLQDPNDPNMLCQLTCLKSGEVSSSSKSDIQFTDDQIKSICCSGKGTQNKIYIPTNCTEYSCDMEERWKVVCS